ncbi:MAG: carboxymuconolactone decarboxylase family protein [Promethearchaeota archaeon]
MKDNDFERERNQLMDLMKKSDVFFKNFGKIDDDAFSDGAIPKKYKELAMVAISIVSKCEECIEFHIKECIKVKSSLSEILDAIKMGMMASGSVSYPYVRHSFRILQELGIINE